MPRQRRIISKQLNTYNLGVCYNNGYGVEKDEVKAVEWHERAAEQGHLNAQFNLGVCYQHGFGTGKDTAKAIE